MQITASANHLRMTPRKVRAVVNLVRSMDIATAEQQLAHSPKRAAKPVLKLLRSALANAQHNYFLDADDLRIAEFTVNEGPTFRRFLPRARGNVDPIHRRSSHVHIVLEPITQEAEERSHRERQERLEIEPPVQIEDADIDEGGLDEHEQERRMPKEDEKKPVISKDRLKGIGERIFRRKSF